MSYIYTLESRLAKTTANLKFTSKKDIINNSVTRFNDTSKYQQQNPKLLNLISLTDDVIYMKLESELQLQTVGKALRSFTIFLLEDPDFANEISSKGQLLRTIQTDCHFDGKKENEGTQIEMDDLTFVKGILDYMYKPRDIETTLYKRKKNAMAQMKKIAIESGIIIQ